MALGLVVARGIDAELELVGRGEPGFDAALRGLARVAGVDGRVRFVDHHEGHFTRVAAADIGLMCSRSEALGRVTIEAMKLGKPVVGTAAGGTLELIRHGYNGFLYSPGDPTDLAHWIERLARDQRLAREMGRRARSWASETFNRAIYAAELEEALAPIARNGRTRLLGYERPLAASRARARRPAWCSRVR